MLSGKSNPSILICTAASSSTAAIASVTISSIALEQSAYIDASLYRVINSDSDFAVATVAKDFHTSKTNVIKAINLSKLYDKALHKKAVAKALSQGVELFWDKINLRQKLGVSVIKKHDLTDWWLKSGLNQNWQVNQILELAERSGIKVIR